MVGKKKAKCYKKTEVKVWFRRLEKADKYWLESFRDYTVMIGGGFFLQVLRLFLFSLYPVRSCFFLCSVPPGGGRA